MTTSTEVATGMYIYAFLRAASVSPENLAPQAAALIGIDGASIRFITHRSVSAAVSATEVRKIRPQRKNLAAHQEVVTHLARHCDMLPVAFGLIADDSEQVERLLTAHQETLQTQIDRVSGHVEMAVNLRWAVPNVVQHFVERYEPLAAARQLILSGAATRDDQIALGQQFERLLNAEREQHTDTFLDILTPHCKEIDIQPPREEADCMRLACLIHRDAETAFNDAVYSAAKLFSDEFAISFNGPWPTYSFVKLALNLE